MATSGSPGPSYEPGYTFLRPIDSDEVGYYVLVKFSQNSFFQVNTAINLRMTMSKLNRLRDYCFLDEHSVSRENGPWIWFKMPVRPDAEKVRTILGLMNLTFHARSIGYFNGDQALLAIGKNQDAPEGDPDLFAVPTSAFDLPIVSIALDTRAVTVVTADGEILI